MRTPRYGARIRKLHDAAIKAKTSRYECPKCGKLKMVHKSFSIWACKSCESIFTGGAYTFSTEAGNLAKRLIQSYAKL
ncbi:MAG: 50S ribosomal protein L37ae [Candidatus Micrarchaeota archaeon]|nr:50S ribosomal protein L37ae [Candidatus Micrarchaeota archaeon]